jgi:hypothetical protein
MRRLERWEEPANAVGAAIRGNQKELWTAIPGIVQSFNAQHNTVEVVAAIQRKRRLPNGTWINETRKPCVDVPVHFQSGGGFTLTVPVKAGDECLLVFSSRCIDGWWDKGGVQPQKIDRMHDPSDGFAILGTRSRPRALQNVSADTVQLRSDDGKTLIEIDAHQAVRIVASTKVRLETPLLEVTGKIVAGNDVIAGQAAIALPASEKILDPYEFLGIPRPSLNALSSDAQAVGSVAIPTPGAVLGGVLSAEQQAMGIWNGITNGSFQVSINNALHLVTGLDFSRALNLGGVAATITAGLNLAGAIGTMTWGSLAENVFALTGAAAGLHSVVSFLSAIPGIGTDISSLLRLTAATGALTLAGITEPISLLAHLHKEVQKGPADTGDATGSVAS